MKVYKYVMDKEKNITVEVLEDRFSVLGSYLFVYDEEHEGQLCLGKLNEPKAIGDTGSAVMYSLVELHL